MRSSQLELTPLLKKITISPLLIVLLFDQIVVVKTSLEGNFYNDFSSSMWFHMSWSFVSDRELYVINVIAIIVSDLIEHELPTKLIQIYHFGWKFSYKQSHKCLRLTVD